MHNTRQYEMSPADNVLYFPNNIAVRMCPKNGMSTLKDLHGFVRGVDEYIGRVERLNKEESTEISLTFHFVRVVIESQ